MTYAAFKKYYDKAYVWCVQHWRWLVLLSASLLAYCLGGKNSKSLRLQAELARDQYRKEADMLEKTHAEKQKKLNEVDQKYNKALTKLDKKYDDNTSDLKREKDKVYKRLLKEAKKDPEKLDSLLKDMGISEV
jgi:hypothetical protein